jgi:MFS transporter, DHA1 family, tetracycline resistance protein
VESFPAEAPAAATESPKSRSLLPIFLIVAVDVLGLTIMLPLLPFYAERLGASPTVIGMIVASYAFCQLLAGPFLGRWSDKIGRRPVLLVSQLGTLVGFVILAFAVNVWMVFLARMIDGATAGNLTIAQAYISDVTKPEERTKSFAIIGIAFGLGFLVGPAISGLLSARFGYQCPIFAAAGLSALSVLCTFFLLPRREVVHERNEADPGPGGRRLTFFDWGAYRKYFQDRELGRLLGQWFCFAFSFATFVSGFALFCERRYQTHGRPFGPREVGYVFAYAGFLGIFMQGGLVGRMVKWFGDRNVVRLGFASTAVSYCLMGLSKTVWQLLGANTISSVGGAGLRPALTSLITQKADRREQGVIIGLTQSLTSVAQIAAPIAGNMLIDHHMLMAWAFWCAVTSGIALVL